MEMHPQILLQSPSDAGSDCKLFGSHHLFSRRIFQHKGRKRKTVDERIHTRKGKNIGGRENL